MGIQFQELWSWARRRKVFAFFFIVLTLAVGIIIGTVMSGRALATRAQTASGATLLSIPDPIVLSNGFSAISKKVEPAVVNISTTQIIEKSKAAPSGKSKGGDDSFQDFFDRFFDSPDTSPDAERSLGSGVIVDKKGFILTNDHVIDQATKIQVTFDGDPKQYVARVIGTDKDTDLAVIKIDADHDLPTATLGNSDGVQVGDWVLAFGSPFGLNSTVTAGIVSAKDRATEGHQFQRFVQTDAAINPGNSGGPLVSMAGEIIGINTAIYTGSRGFEGVGFALPSNTAITVYNQLVNSGKVVRGSIGIQFQDESSKNPVLMKELGAPYGVVVELVQPGSPAEKAGLQPGDVITTVNGKPVHSGNDLVDPISQTPIGSSVQLSYVRNKESKDATLTVADRAKLFAQTDADAAGQPGATPDQGQFGVHAEALTPEISHKLGISNVTGAIVTQVDPASFAEDIGLTRGDIITEINHVPVSSIAEYRTEMAKLKPGADVLIKIARPSGDPAGGTATRALTVLLAGTVPSDK
jgi:serine protease Do